MPDIASALKAEISRLARKELRSESGSSKKATAGFRRDIAELKRRMQSLERELAQLRKQTAKPLATGSDSDSDSNQSPSLRFRADGFAQHRRRLGLSAREVGLLLGASPLSVYKWERGQAKPRTRHLQAIAALRKMGKREAVQKLAEVQA